MTAADSASHGLVTAAVLVIGDEILSGRTKDKNIGYIAEYLTALGIDLKEVRVVGDEEGEIVAAVIGRVRHPRRDLLRPRALHHHGARQLLPSAAPLSAATPRCRAPRVELQPASATCQVARARWTLSRPLQLSTCW